MRSPAMTNSEYSKKPHLKENAHFTRDAAAEAVVLLKNEGNVLLFTSKSAPLAVFGITSYDFISGGTGSGDVNEAYSISLIDGLTNSGFSIDTELEALYKPFMIAQKETETKRREKEGLLATPKRLQELELSSVIVQ
jgi:beta-glucosidase